MQLPGVVCSTNLENLQAAAGEARFLILTQSEAYDTTCCGSGVPFLRRSASSEHNNWGTQERSSGWPRRSHSCRAAQVERVAAAAGTGTAGVVAATGKVEGVGAAGGTAKAGMGRGEHFQLGSKATNT